jgi:hypothetical protein
LMPGKGVRDSAAEKAACWLFSLASRRRGRCSILFPSNHSTPTKSAVYCAGPLARARR